MKIFFFAVNRSPFIIELVDTLYSYLPQGSSVKIILMHKMNEDRSHWGEKSCKNPILIDDKPKDIISSLKSDKPDCIIFTGYREREFIPVKKWAKKNDCKIFINAGEKITEYNCSPFFLWLKYQLFHLTTKGVNGVLAIGNRAMRLYQKYADAPTIMIPYTFNMSRLLSFTPLRYDGKAITFLISGRLEQFRDPIYSIKLFSELKEKRPNIKMDLIISGKGSLYEPILELIKELGIEDSVSWMNEFKEWSEIHDIYKKAHMLLCFQEYGGWGLVIPEAMAAGMAVACSSTVDSADNNIIDCYNGLYCNREDKNTTISSILDLIDNPDNFNKLRERARESAQYGDVNFYAKRLASFIQEN